MRVTARITESAIIIHDGKKYNSPLGNIGQPQNTTRHFALTGYYQ
jgi:hypothetical protein